jgi:hypothetical protein
MNRKIILAISLLFLLGFIVFDASSVGRFFRIRGDFLPDDAWT